MKLALCLREPAVLQLGITEQEGGLFLQPTLGLDTQTTSCSRCPQVSGR